MGDHERIYAVVTDPWARRALRGTLPRRSDAGTAERRSLMGRLKNAVKSVAQVILGLIFAAVLVLALWVVWRIFDYYTGNDCAPSEYVECEPDPGAGLP
jgi:hypothetical protein